MNALKSFVLILTFALSIHAQDYGPRPTISRVKQSMEAFKSGLFDPYSAILQNPRILGKYKSYKGLISGGGYNYGWLVAFDCNAKNRYGAYTGMDTHYRMFVGNRVLEPLSVDVDNLIVDTMPEPEPNPVENEAKPDGAPNPIVEALNKLSPTMKFQASDETIIGTILVASMYEPMVNAYKTNATLLNPFKQAGFKVLILKCGDKISAFPL